MARAIALLLVITIAGCSSNYMPMSRGRVAVTMQAGKQVYVRDGYVYQHGFLGGGLEEAVAGNSAAEAAAGEYRSRMKTGFLAMLLGAASSLGGTVYGLSTLEREDVSDTTLTVMGVAVLGGLVLTLVGTGYLASAEPYRWDAINIFNDGGPVEIHQGPPGWAASRKLSLKMRD